MSTLGRRNWVAKVVGGLVLFIAGDLLLMKVWIDDKHTWTYALVIHGIALVIAGALVFVTGMEDKDR